MSFNAEKVGELATKLEHAKRRKERLEGELTEALKDFNEAQIAFAEAVAEVMGHKVQVLRPADPLPEAVETAITSVAVSENVPHVKRAKPSVLPGIRRIEADGSAVVVVDHR